jgi:hypothetical protein
MGLRLINVNGLRVQRSKREKENTVFDFEIVFLPEKNIASSK